MIVQYLALFLIYGFVGYLYETVIANHVPCDTVMTHLFGSCRIPFLTIYGLSAVIIAFINAIMQSIPLLLRVILITLVLTAIECLGGQLSHRINGGVNTWHYTDGLPFCGGYNSVKASAIWFVFVFFFIQFDPLVQQIVNHR